MAMQRAPTLNPRTCFQRFSKLYIYIYACIYKRFKGQNFERFPSNRVQTLLSLIASTSSGAKNIDKALNFVGPRGVLLDEFLLQFLWYARANFIESVKPKYVVF